MNQIRKKIIEAIDINAIRNLAAAGAVISGGKYLGDTIYNVGKSTIDNLEKEKVQKALKKLSDQSKKNIISTAQSVKKKVIKEGIKSFAISQGKKALEIAKEAAKHKKELALLGLGTTGMTIFHRAGEEAKAAREKAWGEKLAKVISKKL